MDSYELLLAEASDLGLIVKEKPLKYNNGRIKGNKVAIRQDIETTAQKTCVLAEELGHHCTSVGDILDQTNVQNRKQEFRARMWAYNEMVGLMGIIDAYKNGCRNSYEVAEYLEVTEEFLNDALDAYRDKYGVYTTVDNYIIYFIPGLTVLKKG
ncbi:ImmA/IrrE family metallo-endopeptidase [uncultured Eubacterium sp.]|uniref:ImmA/IrrE family metallo-endopeptidase n=1 Tax=uncultured Eubacterium sp. TaxID=165185 RepID=UPI0025D1738E|nr:ImmA/IrrE family metallo-endopeptidase [uncultured Eubacterium sp.]